MQPNAGRQLLVPEPGIAMQPVCIVVLLDAIPFDLRLDVFCNGARVASAQGRGRVLVPCAPVGREKVWSVYFVCLFVYEFVYSAYGC